MYIDDCLKGVDMLTHSEVEEPINIGSDELVTINGLVDMVEEIAGIHLTRTHKLDAPKGVNGRNSDNTKIQELLDWQPSILLRDGMEKTYAWIYDQYMARLRGTAGVSATIVAGSNGSARTGGAAARLGT